LAVITPLSLWRGVGGEAAFLSPWRGVGGEAAFLSPWREVGGEAEFGVRLLFSPLGEGLGMRLCWG